MLGILEIFFGPAWRPEQRAKLAPFLAANGYDFYLYGPKSDANLRKLWRSSWNENYISNLAQLSGHYRDHGLQFGVALSPFGAQEKFGREEKTDLQEKVKILDSLGLDFLGLFFDDMPAREGLAERQMEVIAATISQTRAKILFCPSYYSDDPILDRVFGQRPEGYVEDIGRMAPSQVEIAWTGPKVLSDEILPDHLERVSLQLKRKPFLCDNFFANDGPKNCKFLKLKPLTGRPPASLALSSGWSFNPMNQMELSRLMLASTARVLLKGKSPDQAFLEGIRAESSPALAKILEENAELFLKVGLDAMGEAAKAKILQEIISVKEPLASELASWLQGEFTVGSECLTD